MGRPGFEGERRKSKGLRELAGLRRFDEPVEICGKDRKETGQQLGVAGVKGRNGMIARRSNPRQ